MHSAAVGDFLTACRARGLSGRTVEFYGFFLGRLESSFDQPQSADLRAVRSFVASLGDWATSTRRGLVRTLKLFYQFCDRRELADALQMPRKKCLLPTTLEREQVQRLLRAVQEWPRDWALVLLLLDTGLRVSEACALEVTDLDLRGGWLVVRNGKGGKWRQVPMGSSLIRALSTYLAGRQTGPVFLQERHGTETLHPEGVRKLLKRAGRRAGLACRVYPHLLRHTCATMFLTNGGDAFTLQRILGHSDARVTELYLSLSKGGVRERFMRCSPADDCVGGGLQSRLF